jgi:hypothetical protein
MAEQVSPISHLEVAQVLQEMASEAAAGDRWGRLGAGIDEGLWGPLLQPGDHARMMQAVGMPGPGPRRLRIRVSDRSTTRVSVMAIGNDDYQCIAELGPGEERLFEAVTRIHKFKITALGSGKVYGRYMFCFA